MKPADTLYDIACGMSLFLIITYVLDNRYSKKKQLVFLPFIMVAYIVLDWMGAESGIWLMLLVAMYEICVVLFFTFTMTKGHKWNNLVIVLIGFVITNIIGSLIGTTVPYIGNGIDRILVHEESSFKVAFAVACTYFISAVIACPVLKIIKKRLGFISERVAIWIFFIFSGSNVPNYVYRLIMWDNEDLHSKHRIVLIGTAIGNVVSAILLVYIILKIYERIIARDNNNYINQKSRQNEYYKKLVDSNKKLNQIKDIYLKDINSVEKLGVKQYRSYAIELKKKLEDLDGIPLSGILMLDAIISEFYNKFKQKNIIFESSISPLVNLEMQEEGIVGVVNELLTVALNYSGNTKPDGWVNLAIRRKNKMLAINVEFLKKSKATLVRENHDFKYTRDLADEISGAFIINKRKNLVQMCVLLPAMEDR